MATIDSQIEEVEKLITKADNKIVRDALQLQLSALKKKQTGTKNRKAKTRDNVLVGVNEKVFGYDSPRTYSGYGNGGKVGYYPAKIYERTITAVSTKGDQFAFGTPSYGRHSYYGSNGYFSTQLAAAEACKDDVLKQIKHQEETVKDAESVLERYKTYNLSEADRLLKESTK